MPQAIAVMSSEDQARSPYFATLACLTAALLYVATIRFDFVYDDGMQIVQNPLIRSWHNLPLLFKTDVWAFWHPQAVGNYWRPLFMVWALLCNSIFGLHPAGWHALAVLTHVIATY